ncbi:hypothetical protein SNEBB_002101 [Seison nebaliae]|nr:hypothetical protein SNEBB_002101 [Seison nebaliae]
MDFYDNGTLFELARRIRWKFTYGIKKYGYLKMYRAILVKRNDPYEKSFLLTVHAFIITFVIGVILIVAVTVVNYKRGLAKRIHPIFQPFTISSSIEDEMNFENDDEDLRERILELHNIERRSVGSSNMRSISYDLKLERIARQHAALCTFEPLKENYTLNHTQHVGMNIRLVTGRASYGGSLILEQIEWTITRQSENVTISESASDQYKQLVQADTSRVGCGESVCEDGQMVICYYYPSLKRGLDLSYKKGIPCSACPERCTCDKLQFCNCTKPFS